MAEDLHIDILLADEVFGSESHTIAVRVTNATQSALDDLFVEPVVLAGKLLVPDSTPEQSTATELEAQRRRLVAEMEKQVEEAYERHERRGRGVFDALNLVIIRVVEIYASAFTSLFTTLRSPTGVPLWAHEALKIQEWADVERLEKDIISSEEEGSFLRKAFMINKEKLERCLTNLANENKNKPADELKQGDVLAAGASLAFPYSVRVPHRLRASDAHIEFHVSYRKLPDEQVTTRSVSRKVTVRPSAFAVPTGSMIGAAAGYGIRSTLASSTNGAASFDWWHLGGSILLGLVFAFVTARRQRGKQAIAVEDFIGGFIIGSLAGLFSQEVLSRLGALLK